MPTPRRGASSRTNLLTPRLIFQAPPRRVIYKLPPILTTPDPNHAHRRVVGRPPQLAHTPITACLSRRTTLSRLQIAMAEMRATSRPLLRRVLSFREPLLLIPYLLGFLGAAASAFFHSYSSFLQSFARSLVPSAAAAKCVCATSPFEPPCGDGVEEEPVLSREDVEEIMEMIGLGVSSRGEGLKPYMGHDEVSRLFDADEPSFAEVRRAFAVFDGNADGFIDAADLQGALARLGFREDAAACGAMIAASCGSRDGRMNLFQFVRFLETGLC